MPEEDAPADALAVLLALLSRDLDRLETITRHLHPPLLAEQIVTLGADDAALEATLAAVREATLPEHLAPMRDPAMRAAEHVLRGNAGLRAAATTPTAVREAYRATRQQYRALEALYPLAAVLPSISRLFTEAASRDDAALAARLAAGVKPDTGVFHFGNGTGERGGFSVYVPEYLRRGAPAPVVFALHGGSGHGRVFLWSWLREARSRGVILVAPTASGDTWSLMEPDIDGARLAEILDFVRARWNVDPTRLLLSGMSDGGTFTLLHGLDSASPFTHLAPVAAAFHPLLVTMADPTRVRGLPIYLVHGALDWMFPIETGRTANQALIMAGAKVLFREIADLSHTYPREENAPILSWLLSV